MQKTIKLSNGTIITPPISIFPGLKDTIILQETAKAGGFEKVKELALSGDSEMQLLLAKIYGFAAGVERDKDEAIRWYTQSSEQGNAAASYMLAFLYTDDAEQKKKLFTQSAEAGCWEAKIELIDYFNDKIERFKYIYELQTECEDLAVSYQFGRGTEEDPVQAIYWYKEFINLLLPEPDDTIDIDTIEEIQTALWNIYDLASKLSNK